MDVRMARRRLLELAAREKLHAVEFLNSAGKIGARGQHVHRVRFRFWNGVEVLIPPHEVPDDLQFELMASDELGPRPVEG